MKRKILLIDTSILVVYLKLPGYEVTGKKQLNYDTISQKIQQETNAGTTLILPMATVIETGNHITHIKDGNLRREAVNAFANLLIDMANGVKPWSLYNNEKSFSSPDEMIALANDWREKGVYELSLGDASILKAANQLKTLYDVEVFTDDYMLEQLSTIPAQPVYTPRRRNK